MEIKTKDSGKDLVRMVDRAGLMAGSFKDISMRVREDLVDIHDKDESTNDYATGIVEREVRDSERIAARAGGEIIHQNSSPGRSFEPESVKSDENIHQVFSERSKRTFLDRKMKTRLKDDEVIREVDSNRYLSPKGAVDSSGARVIAKNRQKAPNPNEQITIRKHELTVKRMTSGNAANGGFRRIIANNGGRRTEKFADRIRKLLKSAIESTKSMIASLTAGGAAALLIVVIMIFCGAAFTLIGDGNGDNFAYDFYEIGSGDTAIVKVAQAQLGNVGGDKYWKWYGFSSHVHWCACFVSWCSNECGYIKAGIMPKFAGVGDGANWFKTRHRWANGGYSPKPGDVIFFDWNHDGGLDHVGLVESCDGKTITTIEGNSGNVCRRQSYRRGASVISGYGIPAYPTTDNGSSSSPDKQTQ